MPGKARWVAFHATHLGLPGILRRVFFIKKRARGFNDIHNISIIVES